jgi:hypothetical protein
MKLIFTVAIGFGQVRHIQGKSPGEKKQKSSRPEHRVVMKR